MKNMKLTNLSLSVLIALGLVACGGSDNKDNTPLDKDQHGETGGNGGNGGKPEVTPEHTGTLPQRYVPGLDVPDDLKGQVAARKRFAVRRGFADPALGYIETAYDYDEAANTDPEDIKRKSLYNYVEEKDLVVVSADGKRVTGGFKPTAKGAISVGIPTNTAKFGDINDHQINAWAKGTDGKYYRLVPNSNLDDYKADTEFKPVDATEAGKAGITLVKQKDVVFIANARLDQPSMKLATGGVYILGDATKQKEVILDTVSLFGNSYDAEKLSQNIDLSQLPKDTTKIQVEDIKAEYRVINTKGTATSDDDKTIRREATVGKVKVYNLPHTIAFVTTNADMSGEKNVFNLSATTSFGFQYAGPNGSFRLNGLETPSLPKDGRAIYKGKSFSADVEGNIELVADFFENEAGVTGRVYNRQELSSKTELPELTLDKINLVGDHGFNQTWGGSTVTGDEDYADSWTIQFYGMDAQEAGGFLYKQGGFTDAKNNRRNLIKEVYTSQRGELRPKSNDNTVK